METTKGYVYVLINPSMQGLVKIGKTTKLPKDRVKELSSATGVATPFTLVYHRQFNNCHIAEKKVHQFLEDNGFRVSESREFFALSITDAINVVQTIPDEAEIEIISENIDENTIENLAELYYNEGDKYYIGNSCFQDFDKAICNFQKAADLGSFKAHRAIAWIYRSEKNNIASAIAEYKKSAEKGDIISYAELGVIYMSVDGYKNDKNAVFAWETFFANFSYNLSLDDFVRGRDQIIMYLYYCKLFNKPIGASCTSVIMSMKPILIDAICNLSDEFKPTYEKVLDYLYSLDD